MNKHILKKTFYTLGCGLSIFVSVYFFYEWIQEWIDSSSKFSFGLDIYVPFGISTILLPLSVGLAFGYMLFQWRIFSVSFQYCFNALIILGSLVLLWSLKNMAFLDPKLWHYDSIFLFSSLGFIAFGVLAKKKKFLRF